MCAGLSRSAGGQTALRHPGGTWVAPLPSAAASRTGTAAAHLSGDPHTGRHRWALRRRDPAHTPGHRRPPECRCTRCSPDMQPRAKRSAPGESGISHTHLANTHDNKGNSNSCYYQRILVLIIANKHVSTAIFFTLQVNI